MKRKGIYFWIGFIAVIGIGYWLLQQGEFQKNPTTTQDNNNNLTPDKVINTTIGYGVSSSNPLAVNVGMDILENGGNAVDAAIAVSYALGVVEPHASGIGGGGGMLIVPGDEEESPAFFDYRETSPISGGFPSGGVGIPGFVKGMEKVHQEYGEKEMAELITPSIILSEKGFKAQRPLPGLLHDSYSYGLEVHNLPNFFPNGTPIKENDLVKQPELAETLMLIKEQGSDAFYNGIISDDIAKSVNGISTTDFKNYSVLKREPVYGEFLGYEVISAPPPFSGITLIQSLQMIELLNIQELANDPTSFMHITGEVFKRTYKDRIQFSGDPEFVNVPIEELTSLNYSKQLVSDVSTTKSSDDYELEGEDLVEESVSTTHFVVIDAEGTVVSVTNTLGDFFGAGINSGGFFLNGSLKLFNNNSNSPNNFEPGKRSRTFTSPTVLKNEDQVIGIGTPGGRRIPMMLTEVLARYIGFEESLDIAIEAPRFYSENNNILTEYRYPKNVTDALELKGYRVEVKTSPLFYGGIQSIVIDKKDEQIFGGADSRRNGIWEVK